MATGRILYIPHLQKLSTCLCSSLKFALRDLGPGMAFQKQYMSLPINDGLVRRGPSLVSLRMQGNLDGNSSEHESVLLSSLFLLTPS
jgi:hypothetical protein